MGFFIYLFCFFKMDKYFFKNPNDMNNLLFISIQLKSLLIVILWSLTPHAQSCFIFSFLMSFFNNFHFVLYFSGREERGLGMNCFNIHVISNTFHASTPFFGLHKHGTRKGMIFSIIVFHNLSLNI